MASYGGTAALVVNKQETDRERRLRLRREEFSKRGGLGGSPSQDQSEEAENGGARGVYSHGGQGGDGLVGGGERDWQGGGGGGYLQQQQKGGGSANEPASRESIWEAKKRRYLEL